MPHQKYSNIIFEDRTIHIYPHLCNERTTKKNSNEPGDSEYGGGDVQRQMLIYVVTRQSSSMFPRPITMLIVVGKKMLFNLWSVWHVVILVVVFALCCWLRKGTFSGYFGDYSFVYLCVFTPLFVRLFYFHFSPFLSLSCWKTQERKKNKNEKRKEWICLSGYWPNEGK